MWPSWSYLPHNERAPAWVNDFVAAVHAVETSVSTVAGNAAPPGSDDVLQALAPGLRGLGYEVESSKARSGKVLRPVLFGENGTTTVMYEVDAAHDGHRLVVEVEAGRGARNNAAYRDLIRASLILDADYLVLVMPLAYRYGTTKQTVVAAYREARDMLEAVYASRRLPLPFKGVLLVGY
jgi:hypothetical protein